MHIQFQLFITKFLMCTLHCRYTKLCDRENDQRFGFSQCSRPLLIYGIVGRRAEYVDLVYIMQSGGLNYGNWLNRYTELLPQTKKF